ncbi:MULTISPECIES: hypothetical protein [unclassified Streptomyces]|uniref:hypothetical protein n=1 Tax=unclassified Streptomyces TaxID=2593676 RepID=UPI002E2D8E2F|nr:hypothetical protein [Streptomyces sp. NBC_00228]WSW96354.1 hypothetical protein OG714_44005 [Streptomyces sp. NBC_00989]
MTEPAPTTASSPVHVDYHTFELTDSDVRVPMGFDTSNGLVFSRPGHAVICTGINSGPVNVSIQLRRYPPERADTGAWDEVVDHSVETRTGHLRVTCVMDDPPELPPLTPFGPGSYRVRVHARGRDTAPDGHVVDPGEDYLLIVWPDELRPDQVHKQTDRYGAQLRGQPGRPAPPKEHVTDAESERQHLMQARLQRRSSQ